MDQLATYLAGISCINIALFHLMHILLYGNKQTNKQTKFVF